MPRVARIWWIPALLMLTACSVMSQTVEEEALPEIPFPELIAHAAAHLEQTVILGGYVLEVSNLSDHSRMVAIQAPLGMSREPQSKDQSQGRLILEHPGFLDPEVYVKDRKITVAGRLQGSSATDARPEPFPYVRLRVTEIHLWSEEIPIPYDPYWDPWWGYPYPYYYPPYPWGYRHYPYHRW
ncbi:MAG: Slp family lipoprotein [Desulfatitalea sp.]|nr:Slp family lipoprotein [Desulfatitalea sp.]